MYVLVMNIIGFFSKSEWIDLFSGILLWATFSSQKKQFKSQKDQFKEQNEQSKNQLEQQKKDAKEQLEVQNELALKKEKRMLVTKIRLDKHELFLSTLTEYTNLVSRSYWDVFDLVNGVPTEVSREQSVSIVTEDTLKYKILQKEKDLDVLIVYYPSIKEDLYQLFRYQLPLNHAILSYFTFQDSIIYDKDSPQFEKLREDYEIFAKHSATIKFGLISEMSGLINELESEL